MFIITQSSETLLRLTFLGVGWLYFHITDYSSNRKNALFHIVTFKCLKNRFRPCRKIGQSPPRVIITKTCLYSFDPLKPHFYIVKLGFTGVYIIFLFLLRNINCGYSLESPHRGDSNEYPQSMFWAEIWKISEILSKNSHFFGEKIFSIFE